MSAWSLILESCKTPSHNVTRTLSGLHSAAQRASPLCTTRQEGSSEIGKLSSRLHLYKTLQTGETTAAQHQIGVKPYFAKQACRCPLAARI